MKYKREAESDVIESRAQITTEPMAFNRDPALSRSGANSFLYRLHKHYGNRHLQKILASYAKGPAAPKADYSLQAGSPASVNLQRDMDDDEQDSSTNTTSMTSENSSTASDSGQNATQSDDSGLLSVQDDFQPAEYDSVPDEDMYVAVVDSDRNQLDEDQQAEQVAAPEIRFVNLDRVGTVPVNDSFLSPRDRRPHAFTNGGRTGTVVWAGGGGAGPHGNEGAGSIQSQTPPVYQSRSNPPTDAGVSNADAWVQAGTGNVNVTRSFVGCNGGNQANGFFVTAGAAARFDQHERAHITNSQGHYNTDIAPLLTRIANSPALGRGIAPTEPAAISALKTIINWPASLTSFQTGDSADNAPGGSVDTNDLASGTYPVDAGPGMVGGTNFAHRVRLPGEPNPT